MPYNFHAVINHWGLFTDKAGEWELLRISNTIITRP